MSDETAPTPGAAAEGPANAPANAPATAPAPVEVDTSLDVAVPRAQRPAGGLPRPRGTALWAAIATTAVLLVGLTVAVVDLRADLSHLNVTVLSGSAEGHYHAVVGGLSEAAQRRGGAVENAVTAGSLENVRRLTDAGDRSGFALVQDGLPWEELKARPDATLELIARLPTAETVFFLGPKADAVRSFADLRGKRIGIGPPGSGTARLARQLFACRGLDQLEVTLENHALDEQLELLRAGALDLGVFVMERDAPLIDRAVREHGLGVAGFEHAAAAAHRLPFLRAGLLPAGHYDPVRVLPAEDKRVLEVDTLLVSDGRASRSEVVALLSLLSVQFPRLVEHNRHTPRAFGLEGSPAAASFFEHGGPELLDEHVPWLADLVPLTGLVHMVMVVSVLFNMMGAGHRFRLWRIDAGRVRLEQELPDIFGPAVTVHEIADLTPEPGDRTPEKARRLDALIEELEALKERCRKHSLSVLVPMGREMAYRFQESMIDERIAALRGFRTRLG